MIRIRKHPVWSNRSALAGFLLLDLAALGVLTILEFHPFHGFAVGLLALATLASGLTGALAICDSGVLRGEHGIER